MAHHSIRISSFLLLFVWITTIAGGGLSSAAGDEAPASSTKYDAEEILGWIAEGDVDRAHAALVSNFWRSERNPDPEGVEFPLSERKIHLGAGLTYTTEYKLRADLEQAEYLAEVLASTSPSNATFFGTEVAPTYRQVLGRIPPLEELERTHGLYAFRRPDVEELGIRRFHNKALYLPEVDEFVVSAEEDGSSSSSRTEAIPILSQSFDADAITKQWFEGGGGEQKKEDSYPPGVVVIDDVLSPEALERVRRVMLESTVFYQTKLPKTFGSYLGAYIDDGLHDRILLKLAIELRAALPRIMADHPLKYMWAYKYSSDNTGINLHADEAAVNVNLWITPDEANLDPTCGGLVVYSVKPPADWDLDEYNRNTSSVYEELLRPADFANVTVPYRTNRVVMFDSALFHQTDEFRFRTGYANRRINLTLLYGKMQRAEQGATTDTRKEEL